MRERKRDNEETDNEREKERDNERKRELQITASSRIITNLYSLLHFYKLKYIITECI